MGHAVADNRYILPTRYGQKYYIEKQASEKFWIEIDMSDWLAAGSVNNTANLTVAGGATMGTWSDPGVNAPVATAGAHTPTKVVFALTGGSQTLWNAGAAGGYGVGQGVITMLVTAPTTGEKKEIMLVVRIVNP